jgi:uncharacterized protein YaiL (DUF2058 family)
MKSEIKTKSGIWANTLIVGAKTHQVIRSNPQVLAFSQPTSSERPSRQRVSRRDRVDDGQFRRSHRCRRQNSSLDRRRRCRHTYRQLIFRLIRRRHFAQLIQKIHYF